MKKFKRKLWKTFFSFIGNILPSRTKRLIVLTALGSYFNNTKSVNNETLERLNKLMVLCSTGPNCMNLPIMLKSVIWNEEEIQNVIQRLTSISNPSEDTVKTVSDELLKYIPDWLYYDSGIFKKDVVKLISNRKEFAS